MPSAAAAVPRTGPISAISHWLARPESIAMTAPSTSADSVSRAREPNSSAGTTPVSIRLGCTIRSPMVKVLSTHATWKLVSAACWFDTLSMTMAPSVPAKMDPLIARLGPMLAPPCKVA